MNPDFNPHSPHGERHYMRAPKGTKKKQFQPTLPARGATAFNSRCDTLLRHFNPHSPHGERHDTTFFGVCPTSFQPTLPARGATPATEPCASANIFQPTLPARGATRGGDERGGGKAFQPTLPARGATRYHFFRRLSNVISTHTPRTGSDVSHMLGCMQTLFQPTLPARGATGGCARIRRHGTHFNPHSPHGERLPGVCITPVIFWNFNPHSPHGERQGE